MPPKIRSFGLWEGPRLWGGGHGGLEAPRDPGAPNTKSPFLKNEQLELLPPTVATGAAAIDPASKRETVVQLCFDPFKM